jgi:hypothetical protein
MGQRIGQQFQDALVQLDFGPGHHQLDRFPHLPRHVANGPRKSGEQVPYWLHPGVSRRALQLTG